ncbi:hypothetical protein J2T04_004212 [Chryseobacterium lathyri]|uniref:Uncharacterized protein n=1 Tax=Chryseobacterium lathyri TaxID=395933 RepID=A0ABT9SS73_9FLAO|nr:hypothetical protein [Chryseobacterium lathyri]
MIDLKRDSHRMTNRKNGKNGWKASKFFKCQDEEIKAVFADALMK